MNTSAPVTYPDNLKAQVLQIPAQVVLQPDARWEINAYENKLYGQKSDRYNSINYFYTMRKPNTGTLTELYNLPHYSFASVIDAKQAYSVNKRQDNHTHTMRVPFHTTLPRSSTSKEPPKIYWEATILSNGAVMGVAAREIRGDNERKEIERNISKYQSEAQAFIQQYRATPIA